MKVALVSPPFISDYMRNARCDFVSLSSSSWFPIWLGLAGSYLEAKGHKTILLDAQLEKLDTDSTAKKIIDFNPEVVAVYTGRLSRKSDIDFADYIESLGFKVVFVGPYTSVDPEGMIKDSKLVRFAIKKEFDLPLEEIASGMPVEEIENLCHRESKNSQIIQNKCRPLYTREILDQFPPVSKYFNEHIDIYKYKTPSELYPFIDIMSGRGCAWGRCNFCLWVQSFVPGSVYNQQSIDVFMREFEYISKHMPAVKSVMIQDDMLTNKRAREIAIGLLERGIKIKWSCYAKPNSGLTAETLTLMKLSGCLNLHVGFESGNDDVLENIDKGSTREQAIEFADMVHKAGIDIHGDFAMGHFGDNKESMQDTLDLAKRINPHTAQFQIMIPFEGTKFYKQLSENNLFDENQEPSYVTIGGASSDEVRDFAKHAYRNFYISKAYFKKIAKDPVNYFFNRFDQYAKAIPAVTWKKWVK